MTKVGGTQRKFYKETRGIKVSGGQTVKGGTVITREGHHWKPGLNINGTNHITAGCDGEVYFTHKRNKYRKVTTYVNIRPLSEKAPKTEKKVVKK